MKADSAAVSIRHNAAARRFEAGDGGALGVAEYQVSGDQMVLTHTYVPPEQRGRGIAEQLVRAALEHARAEKRQVVPACSYVARFIERHREYADLLA